MTDPVSPPPADAAGLIFTLDPWGRLVLETPDGARHVGVEPVRAFPITDPTRWIVFVDPDGREVLSLDALDGLAPASREARDAELSLREFVPVIRRILSVSSEGTPSEWSVETDRGPTRFTLDNEEDVRRLGASRVLITDARKLRYHVPDTRKLDVASRRVLERFL